MECPKCGFFMDAFTTECPRCKQLAQKTAGQAPAASAPGPAPVPAAPQPGNTPPVQRPVTTTYSASASGSVTFGIRQLLAIVGALVVLVAIFLPLVNMPVLGGVSIFQISKILEGFSGMGMKLTMAGGQSPSEGAKLGFFIAKYLWIILIVLGLGSIATTVLRRYLYLWISGGLSAIISLVIIIGYFVSIAKANAAMKGMSMMSGAAEGGKMLSASGIIPLGIGSILLLIGAIIILTAAALQSEDA